jgi:hypothetical protein
MARESPSAPLLRPDCHRVSLQGGESQSDQSLRERVVPALGKVLSVGGVQVCLGGAEPALAVQRALNVGAQAIVLFHHPTLHFRRTLHHVHRRLTSSARA